jgi:cytochrome c biogenesis protein CcmG/thiol:disulfide interchange protein DsbE
MSEVLEQTGPPPEPQRDPAGTPDASEARPRRVAPIVAAAVAVVVGLFVVLAAVVKGGSKDTAETPLLGQPAPVVETTTVDGRTFDLASRRGSWVVLNFFSTWCRPCVEEHPELVRFANAQAAQPAGAELYSVIFNDDPAEVERFFTERGGDWPKLVDPDGRIQVAFGVAKSPETWIIDPAGVVRARVISAVSADTLSGLLTQLQAGVPPGS